jgi:hypothetical protein
MDLFGSPDDINVTRSEGTQQLAGPSNGNNTHLNPSTSSAKVSTPEHGLDFSFLTDFDTAFSQFSTDFAINTSSALAPTASSNAIEDDSFHFANGHALTPLLNEKESNAFSDFLERVMVDRNFVLDPKMVDELPQWTEPESLRSNNSQSLSGLDLITAPSSTGIIVDNRSLRAMHQNEFQLDHGLQEINEDLQNSMNSMSSITDFHDRTPQENSIAEIGNSQYRRSSSPGSSSEVTADRKSEQRTKKRENLSEDQKRLNHISSEKRRRALIKHHFEEICSLVPQLDESSASGLSKSETLNSIYEYLALLVEQNKSLTSFLKANGIDISRLEV